MHINLIVRIRKIFGARTKAKGLPGFEWVFGCSPGAAADIAADLDRGGVSSNIWFDGDYPTSPVGDHFGYWDDGKDEYPSHPLVASQKDVAGRTTRGTINNYWVSYDSTAPDPYITGGWERQDWGDAVGPDHDNSDK